MANRQLHIVTDHMQYYTCNKVDSFWKYKLCSKTITDRQFFFRDAWLSAMFMLHKAISDFKFHKSCRKSSNLFFLHHSVSSSLSELYFVVYFYCFINLFFLKNKTCYFYTFMIVTSDKWQLSADRNIHQPPDKFTSFQNLQIACNCRRVIFIILIM